MSERGLLRERDRLIAEIDSLKAQREELVGALEAIAAWEPSAAPSEPSGMSIMEAIDIARTALRKARKQHDS